MHHHTVDKWHWRKRRCQNVNPPKAIPCRERKHGDAPYKRKVHRAVSQPPMAQKKLNYKNTKYEKDETYPIPRAGSNRPCRLYAGRTGREHGFARRRVPVGVYGGTTSAHGVADPCGGRGQTTEWEDGDEIVVSMGGRQAIYTYKGGTWSSDSPLYWENTTQQTVTAWYPVDETIDFTHQDQGLAYLMKGECEGEVPFNTTANLTFTHQLAKVRVLLDGEKASEVADVTVRSYPQSANNKGELGGRIGDPVYVPMLKTEYEGKPCWEAPCAMAILRQATLSKWQREEVPPCVLH